MRTPPANILRGQETMKIRSKFATNEVEVGRDDAEGDPASEIHQTFERGSWRSFNGKLGQRPANLALSRGRQSVEHCHMGWQAISLDRIMGDAQPVEPGEIGRTDLHSDDQRAGH